MRTNENLKILKNKLPKPPVLQATAQATLEHPEPLHQLAEMAVVMAESLAMPPKKPEKKKRGRKRKIDKEFKYFLDVPKDLPESPLTIISTH